MSVGRIRRNHKKTKRKEPDYSSDEDENNHEIIASKKRKLQPEQNSWCIFELICAGYIRNNTDNNIPQGIAQNIFHFYTNVKLFKAYESFNNLQFQECNGKIAENFKDLHQHLVYPLPLIYKKYLLKVEQFEENNKIYGKYNRADSPKRPLIVQQDDLYSHKIDLSSDSKQRIYHLLDSFIINKFSDLFTKCKQSNYNYNSLADKNMENMQGPYGGGFRAIGGINTRIKDKNEDLSNMEFEDSNDEEYNDANKYWKIVNVWESDEDEDRVETVEENEIDYNNGNKHLSRSNIYKHLMNKIVLDHTKGMYDYNSLCIGFKNGLDTYIAQKNEFGKIFLSLFDGVRADCIKAYTATNMAHDVFGENGLNEDRLLCVMDDEKIVAVWTMRYRLYG